MTIETKYNIVDEVWFMLGSKARQGKILEIVFNKVGHTLIGHYYNVQVGMSFLDNSNTKQNGMV